MADAVQTFCSAARDLSQLQERTREELREVREAKKAAQAVLLELHDDRDVVVELPEGTFCLRVKSTARRPSQPLEVLQSMEEFWLSGAAADLRLELERDATLDPIDAFVERAVDRAWPPPISARALDLRPAKANAARLQDLPAAPGTSLQLVANVMAAKSLVSERLAAAREEKRRLTDVLKSTEQRIVPELAELPSGYVRKVSFAEDEAFFLRLKPPRKPPPRRVSSAKVSKSMKALLSERVALPDRATVLSRLSDPDFGVALCRDVAALLGEAPEASTEPRVALDRVRTRMT